MLLLKLKKSNEAFIRTSDGDIVVRLVNSKHGLRVAFHAPRSIKINSRQKSDDFFRDEPKGVGYESAENDAIREAQGDVD